MVIAKLRTLALVALLTLTITAGSVGIGAASASAATAPVPVTASVSAPASTPVAGMVPMAPIIDDSGGGSTSGPRASELNYLPVIRWAGSTGKFHSRLNSSLFNSDLFERLQRDVVAALFMTLGDTIWSATAGLTTQAIRLDVFSVIGSGLDRAAAALGNAMLGNAGGASLVLLLIIASVIAALITGRRSGARAAWKAIGPKIGVVALMAAMSAGALASTGSGDTYRPGVGSPGWMLTKTEQVVSTVASAPAAALSVPTDGLTSRGNPGPYSCAAYTNSLRDSYFTSSGGTRLTNAAFVTPVVMSSLWEQTGLEAWKAAQFGMHKDNSYGDRVYCRLLENFSGIPTKQQAARQNAILRDAGKTDDADLTSIAFRPVTNQDRDMSLVAWAACDGPSENRNADALTNTEEKSGPGCEEWWGTPAGEFDTNHSRFDWEADPGFINTEADGAGAQDFLHALHGDVSSIGPAGPAALAYLISAVAVFVVFGGVSLLVILAKIGLLFMAVAVMIVLVVSLIPGVDVGQKIGQFGKQALGLTFISAGAVLVFSFLAFFTQIVQSLGSAMFSSIVMQMLWVAIAPIAAAVIINWIFKKLLKMPSPFKPSSVMAYGAAASGIGGAAGGLIGGRMGAMARGAQHAAGRRLMGAASSAVKSRMPAALRKGSMAAGADSSVAAKDKAQTSVTTASAGTRAAGRDDGAANLTGAARRRAELLEERSSASKSKHAAEGGKVSTLLSERREASQVANQLRDEQHAESFGAQMRARRAKGEDGSRQGLGRAVFGSARTAIGSNIADRAATFKSHPVRSTGRTLAAAGRAGVGVTKFGAKAGIAAVGIAALGPMALPAIGAYAAVKTAPRLASAMPGGARDRSVIEAARLQHEAEQAGSQRSPRRGAGQDESGTAPDEHERDHAQGDGDGFDPRTTSSATTPPSQQPTLATSDLPPQPLAPGSARSTRTASPPVQRTPVMRPRPSTQGMPADRPERRAPQTPRHTAPPASPTPDRRSRPVAPPSSRSSIPGTAHTPGKEETK